MDACNVESATMEAHHEQMKTADPRTVLTYLTFLEHKIGYLRGIICSAPRQIVSAELSCTAVQLVSICRNLAAASGGTAEEDAAKSAHQGDKDSSDHDQHVEDDERVAPGSYEVIQLDEEEILAPHVHSCKVCGKGFKCDANLRMHMRGHGDEYKTLARPEAARAPKTRCLYSCPYRGCKRNREHKSFQPLKTAVCAKNHYLRCHCDKGYACRRCNVKRFSVLADLRTHEKHCGRDRWVCSCGSSFSRKDKLFGHVAAFDGHAPALPPEDPCGAANASGSDQLPEAIGGMEETCFSNSIMFDDFCCSDIRGFSITDGQGLDDALPMGLDSCDFDGFHLF